MFNYIGLDISLNSTAVYINSNKGEKILSFTNKKDNNIYIKSLDECGVKFFHNNRDDSSKDYSENEISKLKHYTKISDIFINEVSRYIDNTEKTYCQIEGYSFSKNTSSILDIVGLSTLIRKNLLNINDIEITIISPKSLKLESCKICYEPINVGKKKPKYEFRNNQGISGGSFKKPQMFRAMLDGNINSPISSFLFTHRDLMEREKIPNPIEDIIDSIFCAKIKIKEIENDIR